jgi:hypothetical protein
VSYCDTLDFIYNEAMLKDAGITESPPRWMIFTTSQAIEGTV